VTEFMLGLPCRRNLSFKSRKVGTRFGVTPLLLGGYNRISGMEPIDEGVAAKVLYCVQRHGRVESAKVSEELGIAEEEVLSALASLSEWASVRPFYNPELGEEPNHAGVLKRVLKRERVHNGGEHAHRIALGSVHAAGRDLNAAEDVAAADNDRDLDTRVEHGANLLGKASRDCGVDSELLIAH